MNFSLLRFTLRLALPCLVPGLALLAADTPPLDAVQQAATEWIKVRAETARATEQWNTERELLGSVVQGLESRARDMEENRERLAATQSQEQRELAKFREEIADQTTRASRMAERLQAQTERLVLLRRKLPPRLSAALELPYRSLARADLPPGERMQLVMTVLNRCTVFNRTITTAEESITVPGETQPRALETIYWGLSHGYALDRTTGRAWLGRPGADGWSWTAAPDAFAAVDRLLAVHAGRLDPEFVVVPVKLDAPETNGR